MKKAFLVFLAGLCLFSLMLTGCDKPAEEPASSTPVLNFGQLYEGLEAVVNVRSYGAAGDGAADDTASLTAAATAALNGNVSVLYFPAGNYRIAQKMAFPTDLRLVFEEGAVLCPDAGILVTINAYIEAGQYAVFGGEGYFTGRPQNTTGNPFWFGAKGDGVTDDADAMMDALDLFRHVVLPVTDKGYYLTSVRLKESCVIGGYTPDSKAKIVAGADSSKLFVIENNNTTVENLDFDMTKASEESVCVFFDTNIRHLDGITVRDIRTTGAYNVISDAKVPFVAGGKYGTIFHAQVENLECLSNRGAALDTQNFMGFIFFKNILVDNSKTYDTFQKAVDFPAIKIVDAGGVNLRNVRVVGDPAHDTGKADGIAFEDSVAVWLFDCRIEKVGGIAYRHLQNSRPGALYRNSMYFYYEDCTAADAGMGMDIVNSQWLQLSRMTIENCGKNGLDGVRISGGSYNQFTDLTVRGATGNGVTLEAGTGVQLTNLTAENNGGYGLSENRVNHATVVGATFKNNQAGETQLKGSTVAVLP